MKNKLLFSGLLFLLSGSIFLFLENTFFQYLDENDYLRESLFLPLGAISVVIGLLLIGIFSAKKFARLILTKLQDS